MSDIAVRVKNVKKNFVLPHEKKDSIKRMFTGFLKAKSSRVEVQHALRSISFDVKQGEFFGIVGRNGSGKSTLLKMLAGIYQPTDGSVEVQGKLVPFIELGVGFNPELTGRENVYLNGALLGFSKKEVDQRYDSIVEFAELSRFMDQKLKNYSSGMQVRLAFSVAIMAEADILLIDEVLAVGDADFQRKCYDYFKSLKKSGKTVIFVTHDMSAVQDYCDRAVLIDEGKVVSEGDATQVSEAYLRLFNRSSAGGDDQDTSRWGNGQIKMTDFSVASTGGQITLKVGLKANKQGAEDFVFGYRFLNSERHLVMGGNTLNAKGGKKLSLGPNGKMSLTFTMPDILGSGTTIVAGTVRLSDGVTVCDTSEHMATIQTAKTESHYPVIAPAALSIKEK
jgi:ABC-2 type transport system ATP-binding protein